MSEDIAELETDSIEARIVSFSFVNDNDDENKNVITETQEFVDVEKEGKEEGADNKTSSASEKSQETADNLFDVVETVPIEQQEAITVASEKEQALQIEAPPEELNEEVDVEIEDEQSEDEQAEESQPSDFVMRTESYFLHRNLIPDYVSPQISNLTVVSTASPSKQKRRRRATSKKSRKSHSSSKHHKRISDDFNTAVERTSLSIETLLSKCEGESMESLSGEIVLPEPVVFDREAYYEKYEELTSDIASVKIRNNFLQKKMVEYFKKRKMEHVLKETDQQVDTQKKYLKKLDDLGELLQLDETRRNVINGELDELIKERDEKAEAIKKIAKQLFDKEKEIGTGLIHKKTGKEIPEKVLETLFKRQSGIIERIAKQHIKYIKIRNRVTEKQKAIQEVDTLGSKLRLVDYQQLRVEHQGFADKLDEREDELMRLRTKCDEIFQTLAHLREKSASAAMDIINEQNELRSIEIEYTEARERKNYFKVERDQYRSMINKLREESGILLKPRLLQDMERAVNEAETTANILNRIKEQHRTQLTKLRAVRKNMEVAVNFRTVQDTEKLMPPFSRVSGLQKGRPSLLEDR